MSGFAGLVIGLVVGTLWGPEIFAAIESHLSSFFA